MTPMRDPLGALLIGQRRQQGRGLREQADALGVSVVAISAWESGRQRPARGDVPDILRVYGIEHGSYLATAIDALIDHPPAPQTRRSDLSFVSYAHQEGDAACPCSECRATWFDANRCLICDGSGLRPGLDAVFGHTIKQEGGADAGR